MSAFGEYFQDLEAARTLHVEQRGAVEATVAPQVGILADVVPGFRTAQIASAVNETHPADMGHDLAIVFGLTDAFAIRTVRIAQQKRDA